MNSIERAVYNLREYMTNDWVCDEIKLDFELVVSAIEKDIQYKEKISSILTSIDFLFDDIRDVEEDLAKLYIDLEDLKNG